MSVVGLTDRLFSLINIYGEVIGDKKKQHLMFFFLRRRCHWYHKRSDFTRASVGPGKSHSRISLHADDRGATSASAGGGGYGRRADGF